MKLSKDHKTFLNLLIKENGHCKTWVRRWVDRWIDRGCMMCPIYIHDDKCTTKKAKTRAISRLLEDEMDL